MLIDSRSTDLEAGGGAGATICGGLTALAASKVQPGYLTGELFCGAGGLSRGFHSQGFISRFANDVWELAVHNFLMNFDRSYARTGGEKPGSILGMACSVEDVDPTAVLRQVTV